MRWLRRRKKYSEAPENSSNPNTGPHTKVKLNRFTVFPTVGGASIVKIEEGPRKGQVAFATLRFSEPNNPSSTWYIDHLHTKRGDLDIDEKTIESRLDEIANMKEGDD